jgi:hypothetical protein
VHLIMPSWSAWMTTCGLPTNFIAGLATTTHTGAVTCGWCKAAYATHEATTTPAAVTRPTLPEAPVSPSPLRGHELAGLMVELTDGTVQVLPDGEGGVRLVGWAGPMSMPLDTPPLTCTMDRASAILVAVGILQTVGSPMNVEVPDENAAARLDTRCRVTIATPDGDMQCEQTIHPLTRGQACAGQLPDGTPWEWRWNTEPAR